MKRMRRILNKQNGAAMIFVLCIAVLVLVLCLTLLLSVSVAMRSAQRERSRAQARVLASTLSKTLDAQLDGKGDAPGDGLAYTLAHEICAESTWLDYDAAKYGHRSEVTMRTYRVSADSLAGISDDTAQQILQNCSVTLYWTKQTGQTESGTAAVTRTLVVTASCTYQGESCSVTQHYLGESAEGVDFAWSNTGE